MSFIRVSNPEAYRYYVPEPESRPSIWKSLFSSRGGCSWSEDGKGIRGYSRPKGTSSRAHWSYVYGSKVDIDRLPPVIDGIPTRPHGHYRAPQMASKKRTTSQPPKHWSKEAYLESKRNGGGGGEIVRSPKSKNKKKKRNVFFEVLFGKRSKARRSKHPGSSKPMPMPQTASERPPARGVYGDPWRYEDWWQRDDGVWFFILIFVFVVFIFFIVVVVFFFFVFRFGLVIIFIVIVIHLVFVPVTWKLKCRRRKYFRNSQSPNDSSISSPIGSSNSSSISPSNSSSKSSASSSTNSKSSSGSKSPSSSKELNSPKEIR
ncbi:hypothetical protein BJ166DRAFT_587495 [Pestalotiopsis sp. NC0098]|nr:hypothetical protein BJ166DRAFT_587495 [Pestalotiopsis sp. NC0098]